MNEAYLPVSCISDELKDEINKIVTNAMETNEEKTVSREPIGSTLFNPIQHQVEEYLASELFQEFFKSRFYTSYRKKAAIQEIPLTTSDRTRSYRNDM